MIEQSDEIYKERMSYLSDRQQDVLMAIATEGRATKIFSGNFVKRYNLNSGSSVQNAIKKLLDDSWIAEEKDVFYVYNPLTRLWLDKLMGRDMVI